MKMPLMFEAMNGCRGDPRENPMGMLAMSGSGQMPCTFIWLQ
nr:hypothetical protein [Bifidobacterium colobi]